MKLVESSDGTVKVVELDQTKHHLIILDDDTLVDPEALSLVDGAIIMKRRGTHIKIVEGLENFPAWVSTAGRASIGG